MTTINELGPSDSVEFRHVTPLGAIRIGILPDDLVSCGFGRRTVSISGLMQAQFDPPLTTKEQRQIIKAVSYLREAFA